jgi:N-acyl-D-aspartate/D-glutamate deacylase
VLSHVETDANRSLVGLSLAEVAASRRADPADTLLDLIDEEDNHVGVVAHNRTY